MREPKMNLINLNWADYFRKEFIFQIEALTEYLEKRLLPTFNMIEDEAKEVSEKEFGRLNLLEGPYYLEQDEIAEKAQEAGISYYETMSDLSPFRATVISILS
jgi:hypothetical protein